MKCGTYTKYLFLLPATAVLAFVVVFPILNTVLYSLSLPQAIGFKFSIHNYLYAFTDKEFWISFRNTAFFVGISVLIHFLLGLGVALLLNVQFKGRTFFRIVCLLPWAIPVVVSAVTWKWIYNPTSGLLNKVLFSLHLIDDPILWLSSGHSAMFSLIGANVWRGFPFVMVVLLAGLQVIPIELYESASIEGANSFQKFRYVTVPILMKSIIVALALDTVWEFRRFDLVKVLTGGGPGTVTEVLSLTIFKQYFQFFRFEYASALAIIMSITIIIISIPYVKRMMRG